jgi:ERCC4-type nuclease
MTMLIDPQGANADGKGSSRDLIEPMRALGVRVREKLLDSADVMFVGRGNGGEPLTIGVEYKKVGDYISSMKGRMQGEQLPKMLKTFDRRYLFIEGDFEHDAQGRLLRRAGRAFWKIHPGAPPAIELLKRLFVMELCGGIYTVWTRNQRQTCLWLLALYRTWTDKDLDKHKSHLALYAPDLDPRLGEDIPWFRDACGRLPGISYERSKAFEDTFEGSMENLMNASIADIANVTTNGRKLGHSAAERIYRELHP